MNILPIDVKFHNKNKTISSGVFAVDNNGIKSLICRIPMSEVAAIKTHEETTTQKIGALINRIQSNKTVPISLVTDVNFAVELGESMLSKSNLSIHKVKNGSEMFDQFASLSKIYLLDGHHRLEAYKQLNKKYIDVCIYNEDDILIFPYHRVIERVNPNLIFEKLDDVYALKKGFNGKGINIAFKGKWHHIVNTSKYNDYVFLDYFLQRNLDVEKNNSKGIVRFVPGMINKHNFMQQVDSEETIGFFMAPLKKSIFIDSVKGGALLPVKSTWTMPRFPKKTITIL